MQFWQVPHSLLSPLTIGCQFSEGEILPLKANRIATKRSAELEKTYSLVLFCGLVGTATMLGTLTLDKVLSVQSVATWHDRFRAPSLQRLLLLVATGLV